MEKQLLKAYPSRQKAIDSALWLTFKFRKEKKVFGVKWLRKTNEHQVVELENRKQRSLLRFSESYRQIHYLEISEICKDIDPLPHWEDLRGMFSSADGELLRFILEYNVPLEKFIRFELASRGHDKNSQWVGFEKAYEIWLK